MTTLQLILNQPDDCSSLSADASFTLEDILLQPDQLIEEMAPQNVDDFDDMFDDDELFQQSNQEHVSIQKRLASKVGNNRQQSSQSSKEEIGESEKPGKIISRERRLKDSELPSTAQIKNMSFTVLKNVTALFQSAQNTDIGIPTVISATGSKFLAVGTSLGNIALFEIGVNGYKFLGSQQHKKYGQITSITISKDNKYLVGGQESGLLTVWDLFYKSQLKKEFATKCKIIKLLFCSNDQFVMNDVEGNICLYTIQKYLWVNLKSQRILQKSDLYFYDIKAHTLHSNTQILALCTLDYVLMLSYKPQVTPIARITRPQDLYFSKLPNVELGRCAVFSVYNPQNSSRLSSDVLCISWSKSIFVYKFIEGKVQQLETLQLMYRFQQQTPIYNMEFISDGIIVTLDNKQTFRTYRLWLNNGGGFMLINETELPQEIVYQRFLKDKNNKYIRSYNNTIISCSFNPKDKQLFFVCKNSVFRCRIHRWNDAINDLINIEKKFKVALRLCLELYNKRYNIFLEYVQINQKTLRLFCEIGKLFLSEKLKQIQKLNENRIKNLDHKNSIRLVKEQLQQAYECLIEYMIDINCQAFLFDVIYRNVIKQRHYSDEYHYKFLDSLQPFIMNGFLTFIPSVDLFIQITGYFFKQGKKNLIDNLIISLEIKSIFYTEAIEICESNKLYRALAYVCSTHGEYIPPLNKLLREIISAQNNNHKQAQQIYYMTLKDYIVKLLSCIYINGNPFTQNPEGMKKSLSTWLTCKQTFTFFTKNAEQGYQRDYFYFLQGMIQSLNQQSSLKQYIHSILKQLMKQKHKQKEIAELFIKISTTINLDHQEIELILEHSNTQTIQKHLTQYLYFIQNYLPSLQKYNKLTNFLQKNKQLSYFFYLIGQQKEQKSNLQKLKILQPSEDELNQILIKFILQKLSSAKIAEHIQDLLKIHSGSTMVYMIQKFSLQIVNERLMTIKDQQYRYLIIRKLLKKIRKEQRVQTMETKKKTSKNLSASKISHTFIHHSESESEMSVNSTDQQHQTSKKRLGKEVMDFYMSCLCKYKKQKRVYYQLTSYLNDYKEEEQSENNLVNIIKIIEPYKYNSSLGLLEEARKQYQKAYKYYQQVYRYYFFEQNYKKLMKVIHCHGRFMRKIFERMLGIAQRINSQSLWIDLLTCVVTPLEQKSKNGKMVCDDIQDVYKKKSNHPFLQQLAEILELCLINVSNKIPISKISQFIGLHRYIFVKEFVLSSFRTTLMTYSKNAQIYSLANEMIKNDQVCQFEQIYSQKIKGSIFTTNCVSCNKQFELHSALKVYSCGHAYHTECHHKVRTIVDKDGEQEQIMDEVDRCHKCIVLKTGGDSFQPTYQLPDFNIASENIIMKSMIGIAKIIPSVMSVIPNPISVFTTKKQEQILVEQKEKIDPLQLQNEVYQYYAFETTLQEKQEELNRFLDQYHQYLQKY